MAKYNKIIIASSMFLEAHHRYINAGSDIDYIISIVLSGSVIGIVSPLLKEQGGKTSHQLLTQLGNLIIEGENPDIHEGIFREKYNSFKHTGNRKKGLKPSNDLEIEANLKKEAEYMLDAARDDFREIEISSSVKSKISKEFTSLIDSLDFEYYT